MEQRNEFHATTIVAIRHDGRTAIAGDGQVTFGQHTVMKANARKVRRLYHDSVLAGFAGSVADAFTLFEKFENGARTRCCAVWRRCCSLPTTTRF